MPRWKIVRTAMGWLLVQSIIRKNQGRVPATLACINGKMEVGLSNEEWQTSKTIGCSR